MFGKSQPVAAGIGFERVSDREANGQTEAAAVGWVGGRAGTGRVLMNARGLKPGGGRIGGGRIRQVVEHGDYQ